MKVTVVGRKQSLKLLKDISKERDAVFAVFCQKDPNVELPGEGDLIEYGVYAKLVKVLEMPGPGNNVTAIIQGLGRCHAAPLSSQKHPLSVSLTRQRHSSALR